MLHIPDLQRSNGFSCQVRAMESIPSVWAVFSGLIAPSIRRIPYRKALLSVSNMSDQQMDTLCHKEPSPVASQTHH
jgi:hypothetical protein